MTKKRAVAACLVLAALAVGVWVQPYGVSWNLTPSIPTGLYLTKVHDGRVPARGDLVCFRYHAPDWAKTRNYFIDGYRLCKPVAAVGGDTVSVTGRETQITPREGGPVQVTSSEVDSKGRPLPAGVLATGIVASEYVVLLAPRYANSMDSRYLGAVPAAKLSHQIWPLWVTE